MKDQVGDANAKWVSPCYSVKDLWGIPKQFQRALLNLNKYNCNKTLGFKIINQSPHEDIQEGDNPYQYDSFSTAQNPTQQTRQTTGDADYSAYQSQQTTNAQPPSQQFSQNFKTMLDQKKPALEDDESYSRNFELVLKTALKFEHLFTEKEGNQIKTFLNQTV